jgi:hypothetical protein
MEKIPFGVWLAAALVIAWVLFKKATAASPSLAKAAGYGAGQGAVDEALKKASGAGGAGALGSFLGGLFGGGSKSGAGPGGESSAFTADSALRTSSPAPSVPSDFDTSNYTTQQGFLFTDDTGDFVAG